MKTIFFTYIYISPKLFFPQNFPPDLSQCVFVIEQALSVRALQELVTSGTEEAVRYQHIKDKTLKIKNVFSEHRHGIRPQDPPVRKRHPAQALKQQHGKKNHNFREISHIQYIFALNVFYFLPFQYLACLSSSSSSDKLAFDVGLQEQSEGKIKLRHFPQKSKIICLNLNFPGEACWWTVHPSSKQRSEGEKVRVGDDAILVSVATERYLVHETHSIIFPQKSLPFKHSIPGKKSTHFKFPQKMPLNSQSCCCGCCCCCCCYCCHFYYFREMIFNPSF